MNSVIHIYAIPPLISMLFLFSLSIVSFFSGQGKTQWKILSMFSMLLGFATFFAFLAINDKNGLSIKHLQISPLFGVFSMYFAIIYAYILTGRSETIRFLSKRVPVSGYLFLGLVFWITLLILLKETNWFIRDVVYIENVGYRIKFGPLLFLFLFILISGLTKIMLSLHKTFKQSTDKVFKEYIFLNIIAFRVIYGSVLTLLFILPLFGLNSQMYIFLAFPIGVLFFYIAIMRYQFKQIDELNINLENKVKERTLELENTQALLVQSKTMASVGQLAAGIAHEINNPVGAVQSIQQSSKKSIEKTQEYISEKYSNLLEDKELNKFFKVMHESTRITLDGTKRITEIVKAMRNFANLDEADLQQYDIHEGLNDTIRLSCGKTKAINITTDFTKVPRILANPAKLNQVFWNIMLNAVQAANSEGIIHVSTEYVNNQIIVRFQDNGSGIPKDILERIFEPGFTTKGVGVGAGLGLSICYKIMQEHHGSIDIQSQVGNGTTVTLVFPVNTM